MGQHILVDDEVWCEAEHVAVALLVRSPSQAEGHEEEPGALQQSHLVVQVQVPKTCGEGRGNTSAGCQRGRNVTLRATKYTYVFSSETLFSMCPIFVFSHIYQ